MPRKAKYRTPDAATPYNTGDATQGAAAPTGLPYGEHQQLVQAQQQVPLPGPPPAAAPAPSPDAVYAAAQQHQFSPVDLFGASQRPNEPITAGLPIGAGPGPEAVQNVQPRVAETLEQIAAATNDPFFAQLAWRQRLRGGM